MEHALLKVNGNNMYLVDNNSGLCVTYSCKCTVFCFPSCSISYLQAAMKNINDSKNCYSRCRIFACMVFQHYTKTLCTHNSLVILFNYTISHCTVVQSILAMGGPALHSHT